jgi:hypothetical protein
MKPLAFYPLKTSELIELHRKLLKGQQEREIRLSDIYNGPSTRAKLAEIARRAIDDMVRMGMAKKLRQKNRWCVHAD